MLIYRNMKHNIYEAKLIKNLKLISRFGFTKDKTSYDVILDNDKFIEFGTLHLMMRHDITRNWSNKSYKFLSDVKQFLNKTISPNSTIKLIKEENCLPGYVTKYRKTNGIDISIIQGVHDRKLYRWYRVKVMITIDKVIFDNYKIDNGYGAFEWKQQIIDGQTGEKLIEVSKDIALKTSYRFIPWSILTQTPDRYFIVEEKV